MPLTATPDADDQIAALMGRCDCPEPVTRAVLPCLRWQTGVALFGIGLLITALIVYLHWEPVGAVGAVVAKFKGNDHEPQPHPPLTQPGNYDLRVLKGGRLVGCAAPVSKFPGHQKYGCAGSFATAVACDAASNPIKDTKYVAAVHSGCETEQGRGTYGYAFDDGVGLKQCAPLARYDWILCPTGGEASDQWAAAPGLVGDSTKRFRVTNKCSEPIWIQQAGARVPGAPELARIEPGSSFVYSIPNRGLPSTRFVPKIGCDGEGNNCLIQSMPPCPLEGCDGPIDTKFEASFGCKYATGVAEQDRGSCELTGQGNPSTYQDWWDGSAVDGWTLPFSVIVGDGAYPLNPNGPPGQPESCGNVVCARLEASALCPVDEFLTPY